MRAVAAGLSITSIIILAGSVAAVAAGGTLLVVTGVVGSIVGALLGFTAFVAFRGQSGVADLNSKRAELEERHKSL